MIDRAFLQFKGIGNKTLEKITKAGFTDWNSVLQNPDALPISNKLKQSLVEEIEEYSYQLRRENISFFANQLKPTDKWRVLGNYYQKASYFDVETNGMIYGDNITVIVCYHKERLYRFVKGEDIGGFLTLLEDVQLLVSFNGISFDIPMISNFFHIPLLPCPHIDLRWVCYHSGYRGGLKNIEEQIGILRPPEIRGLDGMDAIYLWHNWLNHKDYLSRNKLINYCAADVLSLKLVTAKMLAIHGLIVPCESPEELWQMI